MINYLFYLFIIFVPTGTTYGMNGNDWRQQREFLIADNSKAIDLDSEIKAHEEDDSNQASTSDSDNHNQSFWEIVQHNGPLFCSLMDRLTLTTQEDLDNVSTDNPVRTVSWSFLLSEYDIFDHSPAQRAIVLKAIEYLKRSQFYRSHSGLRESEPDAATLQLIKVIQDTCLHEPKPDAETVVSDQGRALFIHKRKSLPHSFKPDWKYSTASTSGSN